MTIVWNNHSFELNKCFLPGTHAQWLEDGRQKQTYHQNMVFLGKKYDVSPYDSQRSHTSMDLGVKWDLSVLFVQTDVKMSRLQICLSQLYSLLL